MQERMSNPLFKELRQSPGAWCEALAEEAERAREAEKKLEYECVSGISRDTMKKIITRKNDQLKQFVEKCKKLEAENAKLDRVAKDWAEACQKNYEKLCQELNKNAELLNKLQERGTEILKIRAGRVELRDQIEMLKERLEKD